MTVQSASIKCSLRAWRHVSEYTTANLSSRWKEDASTGDLSTTQSAGHLVRERHLAWTRLKER